MTAAPPFVVRARKPHGTATYNCPTPEWALKKLGDFRAAGHDNISITGTWNGEMRPGSCGRVFEGQWKDTSSGAAPDVADVAFTLTRLP